MKTQTIKAEHLYVHPKNQFANESLVELIGPDVVNREYHERPVLGGGTAKVIEVTCDEMVVILENEGPMNLKYEKYFEFTGEELLRPAEFSTHSRQQSFRELFDRQVQKHLESFKLASKPSRAERQLPHSSRSRPSHPLKQSTRKETGLVFRYSK
ncbi:MAG TPA: hypothetical protein VL335_00720 [Candidatus Paceibacterota bacterium]|jgi:hypothetical protein|nr:hypothetical protein [Candidatus Paceibacterota bacterium]